MYVQVNSKKLINCAAGKEGTAEGRAAVRLEEEMKSRSMSCCFPIELVEQKKKKKCFSYKGVTI